MFDDYRTSESDACSDTLTCTISIGETTFQAALSLNPIITFSYPRDRLSVLYE